MYSRALLRSDLLTEEEQAALEVGLRRVQREWEASTFEIRPSDEDIHSANERRLAELAGPVGGKLHTGPSRNDQVSTDARLWLRRELSDLRADIIDLVAACKAQAEKHIDVLAPGEHATPLSPPPSSTEPHSRRPVVRLHTPAAHAAGALLPLTAEPHVGGQAGRRTRVRGFDTLRGVPARCDRRLD